MKRQASGSSSDNEWYNEWKRMAMSDNNWEQVKYSDFKFQDETKGQSGSWRIVFNSLCAAI